MSRITPSLGHQMHYWPVPLPLSLVPSLSLSLVFFSHSLLHFLVPSLSLVPSQVPKDTFADEFGSDVMWSELNCCTPQKILTTLSTTGSVPLYPCSCAALHCFLACTARRGGQAKLGYALLSWKERIALASALALEERVVFLLCWSMGEGYKRISHPPSHDILCTAQRYGSTVIVKCHCYGTAI